VSAVFAKKVKWALIVAKPSYMISTPRCRVVAKQIAREVPLKLAGQVFPTHLIILDGQGIDIILGMSWMKLHQTMLDIAKWLVCQDSSVYGKLTLQLTAVVHHKASMHHTMAKSIEGIPVV
jgi:hypothetical protein